VRIASYPDRNPWNPYVEVFYKALAEYGIEHAGGIVPHPSWFDRGGKVDVVHFHWPERIWRGSRSSRVDRTVALITARSVRGVWRLRRFLDRARERGVTRVWTVHNVSPHENASCVDRWGYRALAGRSDLLVCFSDAAAAELRRQYGQRTPVLVISHGSYRGVYPPPRSRAQARQQFGLRGDRSVVGCLGLLRRYKGLELACDAVDVLDGRVQLLIAGRPHETFDVGPLLSRAASSTGRIVVVPRTLTDAEFADAMAASDAVLLPYHTLTSSGVLFAAWTLGAGVIASDQPFFREMLDREPLLGRTFHTGDSADLAAAIEAYLAVPEDERRRAVSATIDALSPDRVVAPFVNALRALQISGCSPV
jgi:glycosyltransferase involved in cell wall biosynthesis